MPRVLPKSQLVVRKLSLTEEFAKYCYETLLPLKFKIKFPLHTLSNITSGFWGVSKAFALKTYIRDIEGASRLYMSGQRLSISGSL